MKKIFLFIIFIFCFIGCSHIRYIPVTSERWIIQRDTIIERIDSVKVQIEKEYIEVFKRDSSHLETKYAVSDAVIDTTGYLRHILKNKSGDIPVRVVTKEIISYRDSIITKEVPIEVEVIKYKYNKIFYFFLIWFFVTFCIYLVKLFKLFKP